MILKKLMKKRELAELASGNDNNSNSREIDQTSTIGVAGSILKKMALLILLLILIFKVQIYHMQMLLDIHFLQV